MSYLLKKDSQNITYISFMNESIYSKAIPSKYNSRIVPIARNCTSVYFASLDSQKNLHIIYKSKDNKIIHVKEENDNYTRDIILDDRQNTYNISNLQFICHKEDIYLFYTANNPYDESYDLIFHHLNDTNSSPQSLLSLPRLDSKYDLTISDNKLILMCTTKNEEYELGLYSYDFTNKDWGLERSIKKQNNPLTYSSLCNDNSCLHIVYMCEQFGQNQLYYLNTKDDVSSLIYTSPNTIEPIIFKYQELIWINWIELKTSKLTFSTNNGISFSDVTKGSSQQDNIDKIHFTNIVDQLYGQRYYGFINQNINLLVLSQIDLENILLNQSMNRELSLLLNSLLQKQQPTLMAASTNPDQSDNIENIDSLIEIQDTIVQQYNELTNFAKQLQDEGKKWRNKYTKAEMDIKKLKEEIKFLTAKSKGENIQTAEISNEAVDETIETSKKDDPTINNELLEQ
ncbi:hypothetical protein EDC18_10187 [Natranaerovirga pectinivora]|uniref:WD40 repeat protein n=1 Tax=Natranaerovirga pectinivora TaxID=682400 RepID=A0A4R3MNJ9_9FIRM|nr:hypothetical protein [Natranaerovirga pectinivora]TCT16791.1 hypothetical protein EDC18_10187 [Natranaerovirga pectinivora]